LRIMRLRPERRFLNEYRVLDRAAWCRRAALRVLLGLRAAACAPGKPVALEIGHTIERRPGKRIAAKGSYRHPVRPSTGTSEKAGGLR
jgi:hypothetical protein